jgi:LemA protein
MPVLILIIVLLVAVISISIYNSLIKLNNLAKEGWSGIEVQLKRRYDLIPNLLSLVEGYAKHEKSVLENVTNARARTVSATSRNERGKSENMLTQALKTLFAVAENYPQLKANENYLALQKELSAIENNIQFARRYYNGTVRDLNIKIESFPSNLIAAMFNFKKLEFFEIEREEERKAPKI